MKGKNLIVLILVLLFGSPFSHAEYKELVTTWEEWKPPAYSVSQTPEQRLDDVDGLASDTEKVVNGKQRMSGHRTWKSEVSNLLDQGQFLQTTTVTGEPGAFTAETAGAVIGTTLTLTDLERIGLVRNPAIHAAKAAFQAELDGFGQVEDLNAVLSRYAAFTQGVMTGVGPMKGGSDMSQSFPFPGKPSLKTKVIVENAAMAALDLNITIRDKTTAIRKAYWNFALVHEKIDILKETLRLFEHLHDIASTMYKTGKTSYQDVIQISIKTKILNNQIATLKENKQSISASILALLDLPKETVLGRPGDRRIETTVPETESLIAQALEKRQEIRRMDHAIVKMELMIEMTEAMVLPSIDMGLSENQLADINTAGTWSKKQAFPDQAPSASMGAGQPKKPWFGTSESWLAQTRKKLAALQHKQRNLKAQTRAAVQSAWSNLDDSVRTYRLYKGSIVELSASALDVSTREYESGSMSFAETAGAYNNWLNARLSLATAKRDACVFRSELQRIVGLSF